METIKKRYTTVANWIEKVNKLCDFNCMIKIVVYKSTNLVADERIFETVMTDYENLVLCFGEYFVFQINNDRCSVLGMNTFCLKMSVCKQRPDEKYYVESRGELGYEKHEK